ncbi:MAG: tetratricopeptide repeat protein [Candidatus Omnitrophota bacterium]|nr:tetratricopeptide repeat protein [Candidatus Omnitrophota bacterium]MDZ4243318.1 tetratricopeptide repeat protein [Candidatus Omnitrophota bacterium]
MKNFIADGNVWKMVPVLWGCFAVSAYAQTAQEWFERGNQAYQEANHKKAVQYYEKTIELDPNHAQAYYALGTVYRDMNAGFADVAWFFKVAADITPDYLEAHDSLCKLYFQNNDLSNAEASCLKALSLNPNLGSAQLMLAWMSLSKSRPQDAVLYFREVLKKTQSPMIYYGLGVACIQTGNSAEALDVITTLQGLGESQLASKLENALRTSSPPSAPPLEAIAMPERQEAGTIVEAMRPLPEQEPEPNPAAAGRIRLRGRLSAAGPGNKENEAPPVYGEDDTRSAVERIRDLQRRRGETAVPRY